MMGKQRLKQKGNDSVNKFWGVSQSLCKLKKLI